MAAAYYQLGFVKTNKGEWINGESVYRKALELTAEIFSGSNFYIPIKYNTVGYFEKAQELHSLIKERSTLTHLKRGSQNCTNYNDDDNLRYDDLMEISLWSAYFGDLQFAIDAMEKGLSIESSGLFWAWLPVMREVRKLP